MLRSTPTIVNSYDDTLDKLSFKPSSLRSKKGRAVLKHLIATYHHRKENMILSDVQGLPMIPKGLKASISHLDDISWASLTNDHDIFSLGLCVELHDPSLSISTDFLSSEEKENKDRHCEIDNTLNWTQVFCCIKKSVIKALFQHTQLDFDAKQITVNVNYNDNSFTAQTVEDSANHYSIVGYYTVRQANIFALTLIKKAA